MPVRGNGGVLRTYRQVENVGGSSRLNVPHPSWKALFCACRGEWDHPEIPQIHGHSAGDAETASECPQSHKCVRYYREGKGNPGSATMTGGSHVQKAFATVADAIEFDDRHDGVSDEPPQNVSSCLLSVVLITVGT